VNITPFDLPQAREAIKTAGALQRGIEGQLREESRKLAAAEKAYRMALAKMITELHASSVAWTTCETIAKGDPKVSTMRYERDVQKGVLESVQQQAFRLAADRRDLHSIVNWSMRRELAENGGRDTREGLAVA
jgi:hypothetical protein